MPTSASAPTPPAQNDSTEIADSRFVALPARPGKIIVVHPSTAARAEETRKPSGPASYVLKPSSSVAGSGSQVERPFGSIQMVAEAEVALVIGATTRWVTAEDAWGHVGWVTAASDIGLATSGADDAGSDVRERGRDGFTPIGPGLIDAGVLDPGELRVREWLNGRLVRQDTTAELVHPLAQLVAELSQHVTLETGDVILTSTSTGPSEVRPGDVVEVEVDAPHAPSAPSSGRLTVTVVQGGPRLDLGVGSTPTEIVASPAPSPAGLTAELRERLLRTPVAGLSAQLRKRGLNNVTIDGVRPLRPASKIVGTAKTLRFIPNREDLFERHGGGYNAQKRAFDKVEPGEVIVIEARGETGSATLGDVLAIRARVRAAAGIVTDGGVRDLDAVAAVGIPVFAAGAHPAVLGRKHVPWESDVTVACGGTSVQPGDIIVGDSDGVIVIPPALADEVVEAALAQEDEDSWIAEQVAAGHPVEGLFPMNPEWRTRYQAWRKRP